MGNTLIQQHNVASDGPIVVSDRPLFSPGKVRMTIAACQEIACRYLEDDPSEVAMGFLIRHLGGDWSQMRDDDAEANRQAAQAGARVLSSFRLQLTAEKGPQNLWVITEADRSVTTFLLPSEY